MNIEKVKSLISDICSLDPQNDIMYGKYCAELTDILSENIQETIDFINTECTDEDFFWLSSIFEDIVDNTQSKAFINTIKKRLNSVNADAYDQRSFTSEHMRKYVDYNEYFRSVELDIEYAEEKIVHK